MWFGKVEIPKKKKGNHKKKIALKRQPDCKHYHRCLQEHAMTDTVFGCQGCQDYHPEQYSMMSLDDMPGVALLLRAIFFKAAHSKDRCSK